MRVCTICQKKQQSSYNRPNSLHKTKRKVYPNLQKKNGALVCTKCMRNLKSV